MHHFKLQEVWDGGLIRGVRRMRVSGCSSLGLPSRLRAITAIPTGLRCVCSHAPAPA